MTPLSLRFAARELRGGLAGFRIFLACLAVGVAAIAAAGSTAEAFRQGLASQAREILGGDLAVSVDQKRLSADQHALLERTGKVAYADMVRAMAEGPSGERRLVELRGVSGDYPLAGKIKFAGKANLSSTVYQPEGGAAGAAVEKSLLDKLGLKIGDAFTVGDTPLIARAVLVSEPDRLSRGFALGPRVLVSLSVLERSGFLKSGLPFTETARIALPPGEDVTKAATALQKALGPRVARVRNRNDATPGLSFLIDQLDYFLSFIGLASLIAGGLGVFGAVSAYLEVRRPSIAMLKAVGASGTLIRNLYLIQIGLLALLGVGIGLAIGAATPLVLGLWVRTQLPIPALFALYPQPLIRAGAFGLLSAAAFSLAPLARARATPPAGLFRRDLPLRMGLSVELVLALMAGAGLAGLALVAAPTPLAAGLMIVGVALAFVLLWLMGAGAARLAGWVRGVSRGALRMGLANLAGPHSAARTAAPAIGLGIALLATVVLIQSSLLREVRETAPNTAPAVVYMDIPGDQTAAFDAVVASAYGAPLTSDIYLRTPFTTGRVVAINGAALTPAPAGSDGGFAPGGPQRGGRGPGRGPPRNPLDRDTQISVIGAQPDRAGIVSGQWWAPDYAGPPLVAIDQDTAQAGPLKLGDQITLSLLGRELDAKVAVIRKVEPGGFGASFPLVLNPSALAGAVLPNVAIARISQIQEDAATRALGARFPQVNIISVREQLEAATQIFDRLTLAVRAAASVAALAGVLVLAGAIAARAQARTREAAILKVLGASRGQILLAYGLEYGAVGIIAGLAGLALGYAAAWPVVVRVFHAHWSVDWAGVAALVGGAAGLAAFGGLMAAFQALAKRPASALRGE